MPTYRQFRLQPGPGILGWLRWALTLAVAAAIGALIIALAVSLTVVLLPIVGIALLIAAWRFRKLKAAFRRGFAEQQTRGPRVIETDYTVLDQKPHQPPGR